jgi:hypothetical protein
MKFTIGLLTLFLFGVFMGCRKGPNLTEDEIYTILNEIILDGSLSIQRACWKFDDLVLSDACKKEFTGPDIRFMYRQKRKFENLRIRPGRLRWYKKHAKVFVNTTIDTNCNKGIVHQLSLPLVSIDRQKVLIEIYENCNCLLGDQGGKFLYMKVNGRWKRVKVFDYWIS